MRLLELPKNISTQPEDKSAKTYRDTNLNKYSSQIVKVNISSQLVSNSLGQIGFVVKNAAQGGIMQALYVTPAWACCFYVFTFLPLFL